MEDWPGLDPTPIEGADQQWPGLDPVQPSTPAPSPQAKSLEAMFGKQKTSGEDWPGLDAGQEAPAPKPEEAPHGVLGTFGHEAMRGAIALPGAVLKGIGVGIGQATDTPTEQGSLYKMGKDIEKYADTWGAGEESVRVNPIAAGAGGIVGSTATALPAILAAGMLVPEAAATAVGLGAGGALFGASAAGTAFDEALLKGADENTAAKAAGLNGLVGGALGVLPLATILAPVRAYTPGLTGWAATALEKAARAGVVFTGVGEAQEFLGRQIAKQFYDPNTGYTPDLNRVLSGLIGGGIIGTVTPSALHKERTMPVTDEALKRAGTGITTELPQPPDKPSAISFDPASTPRSAAEPTLESLAQTIEGQPGANIGRLATLLGAKLYGEPKNLAQVSVKEMAQNAFDAIKSLPPDEIAKSNISIDLDSSSREITVTDTGIGMKPEILANQFLQIAGTEKATSQASGGLGIAKMLFLFGNDTIRVMTARDGKVAIMNTTGPDLMQALSDPKARPKIEVKDIQTLPWDQRAEVGEAFPDGHGTKITVRVPKEYPDTSTGEMRAIDFPTSRWQHPVLERSPLLHPINVTLNGRPLPIGKAFPAQDYQPFANPRFEWGDARIFVGKPDSSPYGENLHILSNGLWQFSGNLKQNPMDPYGPNIKRQFYIDVSSRARPEDPGYPFDLNRQRLTQQAQDDFNKIFNHLSKTYQYIDYQSNAQSFGTAQYVEPGGKVSKPMEITPAPPKGSGPGLISAGDKITVQNGKLFVNGKVIPELTKEQLGKGLDLTQLKIPQDRINPNKVMIHNNVSIRVPGAGPDEYINLLDYGRQRWGQQFDSFLHDVGHVFKDLRDHVVEMAKSHPIFGEGDIAAENYKDLAKEAIGLSFDEKYRGVSIRVPFHGSFINPARPEFPQHPDLAALGYYGTMIHELAHFQVRSHDADFPAEMQRLMIFTESRRQEFVDRLIQATSDNFNIVKELNHVLDTGFPKTVGNRFKESGEFQARDGRVSPDVEEFSGRGSDANLLQGSGRGTGPSARKSHADRVYEEVTGHIAEPEPSRGFLAYHGSPFDYTRVDMAKRGTGEGGAAFSPGFYVGENVNTGRRYQDTTAMYYYNGQPYDARIPQHRASLLRQERGLNEAIEYAEQSASRATLGDAYRNVAAIDGAAAKVLRSGEYLYPLVRRGNLYTVMVKAPKEHFLDWDTPLERQSPYVQNALKDAGISGKETGRDIYELLRSVQGDVRATETLRGLGIPGIRYLDAGSRNAQGERTRNYVIYDEKLVDVTHKNEVPITVDEASAIRDVQKGAAVEDQYGRAVVNGHTVDNITPDELRSFAPTGVPAQAQVRDGYAANDRAMREAGVTDFPKTPVTEATGGGRNMLTGLFGGGKVPPGARAAAVAADHFVQKLRWLWDFRALVDANPHIEPLQRHAIIEDHMSNEATQRQVLAEDTWRVAAKLTEAEKKATYKLIDDYMNARYLTPNEKQKGVMRKPTQNEFAKMVKDAEVGDKGLTVFRRMVGDFEKFVRDMMQNLRAEALELEPQKQAKELARIDGLEKDLLDRPYFPATRFGLFTVLVQGPEGPRFYRTETKRQQQKLLKTIRRSLKPGETVTEGKLPVSSMPFQGLPTQLLEVIEKRMVPQSKEAEELRNAINQLKYESSPIKGITSRVANRTLTPGYSMDFFRNYANFFYHGSRYLSRMKYQRDLKNSLSDLWDSVPNSPDGTKRSEIAQFVQDRYERNLDPRGDWAMTRAFMFHMALGFRVSSAATNLTQTLISTYPNLAAEFGDVRAIRAMTKAGADWSNFYRRATVAGMSEINMRALHELMQLGRIRGALAPELAGLSEGRNFIGGYGGDRAQAAWTQMLKLSSGMFELTEQMNRRVAGMATFELALREPKNKFVQRSIEVDPQLYAEMKAKGFNDQQSAAIVAAKVMIDRTQYQYSREFRPAYLTGPVGGTIGMFKLFTHRMLWNIYNYPAAGMRSLLLMGFLGGLQGIPGFVDLNGILKAIAANFFGKDFDLEDEARKFAIEVLGMKEGTSVWNDPFTVTKGFASRGYGIPALADFIGEWAGVGKIPIPELDRTAAVSLNNILPIDFGAMFGPQARKNPGDAFAQGVSRGMGAFGSYAYNTYKALMNMREGPDSLRRWERVAPVFLSSMSHAARIYATGAETSQTGSKILRFDPHDTEHMMEIVALGLGYTPFRLSKEWTRIRAEREAIAFWDMRKEMLLNQYWGALSKRDKEDQQRVIQSIRNFNKEVRGTDARGMAITAETIEKSMQSRMSAKQKQEAGIPSSENQLPLIRGVRKLFPGAEIQTNRVR